MLAKIAYYCFIYPLSLLPMRLLHVYSTCCFFVVYYIIRYRRDVVSDNMKRTLSSRYSEAEQQQFAKEFYRHFCDLIFEGIKHFSASEASLKKRLAMGNLDLLDSFYKQGKSAVIVSSHYGNWELPTMISNSFFTHQAAGLYTPIKDPFLDKQVRDSRSKFGFQLISAYDMRSLIKHLSKDLIALVILADQRPKRKQLALRASFLGIETTVSTGAEKIASRFDLPVLGGTIKKVKRGVYNTEFTVLAEHPKELEPNQLTLRITAFMEQQILDNPPYWLWTHKRFKHD